MGSGAGEVIRLGQGTGDVVGRIPVRAAPGWDFGGAGLTVGAGSVWTVGAIGSDAGCCDALVTRIDPRTNSVVDELTVREMSEGDLWVDRGAVYVLDFSDGAATLEPAKIRAAEHSMEWRVPVPGQWSETVHASSARPWLR